MSTPFINLLYFFGASLLLWLGYRLYRSRKLYFSRPQRQKALTEDILKQLFHVAESGRTATLSDLSGALHISRRKLLPVIEKMARQGWLHNTNETLELTPEGRDYALKIVRTHRLWEKYLAEKTGHQPAEWHHLAEIKEHELSEEQIKQLSRKLGSPLFDPHGDPIPTAQGEILPVKWRPLPAWPVGKPGKIAHIEDEPAIVYRQILAARLFVGSHLKVLSSTAGEISFACEGRIHRLSPIVAANIHVEPLAPDEPYLADATRLSSLNYGEKAEIVGISQECRGASRRRLLDLGILPGTKVEVELKSPLGDPVAYKIRNTSIALRQELADKILIKKLKNERSNGQ